MNIIDLLTDKEYEKLIDFAYSEFMKYNENATIREQKCFVSGFQQAYLSLKNKQNEQG